MKKISPSNYKKDKFYPRIRDQVDELLREKSYVAPVDLLMKMDRLTQEHYEDWRLGRVSYLEKVFYGNLSQANRILRILKYHAQALGLQPSQTVYMKWGKGSKRIRLRFSKNRIPGVESAYSTHYVRRSGLHDARGADE